MARAGKRGAGGRDEKKIERGREGGGGKSPNGEERWEITEEVPVAREGKSRHGRDAFVRRRLRAIDGRIEKGRRRF